MWERSAGKLCSVHIIYKMIHRRCSGDLPRVANSFRCRRCDGTIQEADPAEDLMVDGETYGWVSFCYLGDTLDGDGGADLAATDRNRNGWMKFQELLLLLTSGAPQLCQNQHDLWK